jgi:DNA-binding GntR family transcriptional regulator
MVLHGELKSGQRITQDDLAAMLGVSTMPVREALLKLTAVGLIEATPTRSFRVARTSVDDIRDAYWAQSSLAGELTRRACVREGAELAERLRALESVYVAALDASDGRSLEAANWAFHRAINRAADAPKLLFILKTTLRFIPGDLYAEISGWGQRSERSHLDIIDAIARGECDAAADAARDHVLEAGEQLIAHFSTRGYWAQS